MALSWSFRWDMILTMLNSLTSQQKKVLCLSSLGGVLEFYDFIIYIFLAPYIEKVFFADSTAYVAALKTLAIFAVGYLVRPLGGIIFSHFGDRYGRKVVFLLTVVFMALPSFAMGLMPTTASIGNVAPVLMVALRLMQGLALGGEIPASITFVSEHVPPERKGIALSILFFGINLGLLLGSFVTTLMTSLLSYEAILAYGWRIPFILAGVFGLIAIALRQHLHETAAFKALRKEDLQAIPVITLLRDSWRQVLQGFFLVSLGSVTVFFYLYWPQYLNHYFDYNLADMMRINTAGTLILNAMILVGGWLSDRYGHRTIYLLCALVLIAVTYPLFSLLTLQSTLLVMLSYFVFSFIFGFIPSSYSAMLSELFPTSVRYSGIALSYNFAFAIFGGLGPLACTLLIHSTRTPLAPAFYIISVAVLSFAVCLFGSKVRITDWSHRSEAAQTS